MEPVEPVIKACDDTTMQHWRPRVCDSFQDERSRAKTDSESDCKFNFGRRCHFGERSSSTPAYIPHDFGDTHACPELDWWMLAVTFAEKGCLEHGLRIGFA